MFRMLLLSTSLLYIGVVHSTETGASYFFYQKPEYPRDCKEVRDECSSDSINGVYTIKPDGYPTPFEVYCDNDGSNGSWKVIQRRIDGSLTFKRNWEDYGSGFGFLASEFWIGLDKLSYLTNQANYEIRIDLELSNGSSFTYKSFRISDEWSNYVIATAEEFHSDWNCIVSLCPDNMTHGSCSCLNMCTDPVRQTGCYTNCVETYAPEGCFVTETNSFISNGESFMSTDCIQNCSCINNQLSCDASFECSNDAICKVKDGVRKCYCNEGYDGNGEICIRSIFNDCYDAYQAGHTTDGVYTIQPVRWTRPAFTVFCDMTTGGGGWTVFQRRIDHMTNFYRNWTEYKQGFGSRVAGNDFCLGNEQIHYLTNQKDYKLRVEIVTSDGSPKYAEYSSFQIDDESSKYRLSLGSYSGDAGNHFHYSNGGQFSTLDQDNDGWSYHDYAKGHKGGWWYTTGYRYWCRECYYSSTYCSYFESRSRCNNIASDSNLNPGEYNGGNGENIFWYYVNCNLNYAEMKIRPSSV